MAHRSGTGRRPLFDKVFGFLEGLRPSDRFIVYVLASIALAAGAVSLIALSNSFMTERPTAGGTLVEGMIGTPRFVNPALAITRTDSDLVALVYSGLMKLDASGTLVPDLAESVTVSDDGLTYNVVLRDDVMFHDGTKVRAEDVAYTIALIQNPDLKSPLRGNWNGVKVEVVSDHELNFVLQDAYAPFLENLTVGIMPKHVWDSLSVDEIAFSQNNTEPVGSGPYRVGDVSRNKSGLIDGYHLVAFSDGRGTPNLSAVSVRFYEDEDSLAEAFAADEVTATASLGNEAVTRLASSTDATVLTAPLPRVFAVFFNQNKSPVLRDASVRAALSEVVDRDALVRDVLDSYGTPTESPIPPGFMPEATTTARTTEDRLAAANAMLEKGGWTKDDAGHWSKEIDGSSVPLKVRIATANSGVFEETAYYLERVWGQLGVEVSVELYEQSDLVQSIIRPRNYEALLFGAEVGRALDLYPFWHSSQREDPGLNVALYANITTDALLKTARTATDTAARNEALTKFAGVIMDEMPAVFLYSPSLTYLVHTNVHTVPFSGIARPSDRLSTIRDWYMNKESVWRVFTN
jgi:peptide/nickel transport system substrate-binding protein